MTEQPLTLDRFESFVEAYSTNHADVIKHLDKIDGVLTDHTKRLDRIEQLLWHGERLAEVERRVIKLAELAGAADLATPFAHFLDRADA